MIEQLNYILTARIADLLAFPGTMMFMKFDHRMNSDLHLLVDDALEKEWDEQS